MKVNIRKLFGLCEHKWKVIHKVRIYGAKDETDTVGYDYHLQCEKCGRVKIKTLQ